MHTTNFARDFEHFQPKYDVPDHKLVREHFFSSDRANIAKKLDDLREWRNDCDYDDETPPIVYNFHQVLQKSHYIVSDL